MIRVICISSLLLLGCSPQKKGKAPISEISEYLFLAHTRTDINPEVVPEVAKIDFSKYNMLWLGGDMAQLSSENLKALEHLNDIFDIKSQSTLWALGNHDYTNPRLINEYTSKPRYYAQHQNGITTMVLDTQDSLCHITGEQLDMFNQVVDTMNQTSHLIILHHKLIWLYGYEALENQTNSISNAPIDSCSYCINPNNFYEDLYPRLVDLKNKGIEVICVGGDIGFKYQQFEHTTSDGIHFLASGMSFNEPVNYGLVFKHNVSQQKLSWSFEELKNL